VIDRRAFLAGAAALLAAPLAAEAQPAEKVRRVGFLSVGAAPSAEEVARGSRFLAALRELGWVEGKNLILESRYADFKPERLPDLAGELVRLKTDVIVAAGTPAAAAAKNATSTIPIVSISGDPVRAGLVTNLARPGGNITGLSLVASELYLKRLQILKEAVPWVKRVAVPYNPDNPAFRSATQGTLDAIRLLGLKTDEIQVRSPDDLAAAFKTVKLAGADAVVLIADQVFVTARARMVELTLQHRLPSIAEGKDFAEAGALLSYAPDLSAFSRQAAVFVAKILEGAKPGDLPVEQPTKFELVINLKTAKALGLKIPQSLLQRADQVIE
jgi:putative tryptophan/tyrosine transport system substrate-binding protein